MSTLAYSSQRGRPILYDPMEVLTLVPLGKWATWKTICQQAEQTFGMSPRTAQRLLRQLRREGYLVLHEQIYHRIK
jgi:DNA-binding transcriptional ArsR family regulator